MKLAVMMPAYNAERFIKAALESLLRQRNAAQFDIIVLDDGSTDGTAEIVRRLASEAPEIRMIQTPNQGIAGARNALLDALTVDTQFVSSLDADDLSPSGRFERDLGHFSQDSTLELHYGATGVFKDDGGDAARLEPGGAVRGLRCVQLGAMIQTLALIRRVGRFDAEFRQGEDTDFILRTLELEPRMKLVHDICVYYRRHIGSVTRDVVEARRGVSRAMLMSIRRRKVGQLGTVPPGFFEDMLGGDSSR